MKHFKVLYFLLMFTILSAVMLNGQAPDTLWTKTFGGILHDYGSSVQQTADGGYIIAGMSASYGQGTGDCYVIKTNTQGDTLWTKTYGGTNYDWSCSIYQCNDLGYIITGGTWSYGAGMEDVYLVKIDSIGDTTWTKTYGGPNEDFGASVQQTFDGGFIIAGKSSSYGAGEEDVWLLKTDGLGNIEWTKTYGGGGTEIGLSVQQTTDSGYVIGGYTKSFRVDSTDSFDVYLIKTDNNGDTLWTRTYGGNGNDVGSAVQQTIDGGYIIVGYTDSYDTEWYDVYLIRVDANGDTLWTKTYGGNSNDLGFCVQETSDGGYIIAGHTNSSGYLDVYLIKTDEQGDTLWTKILGGLNTDVAYAVRETSDSAYVIVGWTNSSGHGYDDVYLIKTEPDAGVEETDNSKLENRNLKFTIYPNPFTSVVSLRCSGIIEGQKVSLQVYDVSGRLVKSILLTTSQLTLDADLSPGIYFLKTDGKYVGKVVKVR